MIPADTWLERVEVTESLASDRYSHERLRDILAPAKYDLIIIDTPPSLCWLTESALIAASHTLVCATPEFYSVKDLNGSPSSSIASTSGILWMCSESSSRSGIPAAKATAHS